MRNNRDNTNYYELLEISPEAPQNEVHRAYQRAKATYSQDNPALYSMFTKEEARELSRMIDEAYTVLGNQSTRKNYDEHLKSGREADASHMQPGEALDSLPDFAIPEATTVDYTPPQKVASQAQSRHQAQAPEPAKSSALPPGMAKSLLSTYTVDPEMEAEIASTTVFDGPFLQKIRAYKNVELVKVIEYTRISRTYLTALEKNDFASLPAAVFVRGFVVQMARILGLDENKVASSYMSIFKAAVEKK